MFVWQIRISAHGFQNLHLVSAFYRRISQLQRGAIYSALPLLDSSGYFLNMLIKFLKQVSGEASTTFERATGEADVKGLVDGDGQVVKGILRAVIKCLEGC